MLTDLDIYVATSMRQPNDFLSMARICETVFSDDRLRDMNLRYFDPTLSAAGGHEDKGLIECLMVKCAKALVYCAGESESYGKDAEAAMALSLGRPVIFYCDQRQRGRFYREVHPLSRLVEFNTGIAVGAMVTDSLDDVAELLYRIFENRMSYELEQSTPGFLRLKERVTGSVVRLQTNNELLNETFWNHYHRERVLTPPLPSNGLAKRRATVTDLKKKEPVEQVGLPLDSDEQLVAVAARSQPRNKRTDDSSEPKVQKRVAGSSAFPLSIEEVFDGISAIKSDKATGSKRLGVLREWIKHDSVPMTECISLLRFIEVTLVKIGVKASFVYKSADLSRWYREMANGESSGSKG